MKKLLLTAIAMMMGLQTAFAMNDELCNKLKADYKANGGQGEFKCYVLEDDADYMFPGQRYYTKEETRELIEDAAENIADGVEATVETVGEVVEATAYVIYRGGKFVAVTAYKAGKMIFYTGPKKILKWLRDNAEPVDILEWDY